MCDIIFVVFIYLNHLYVYVYTCTRTCTRTVRVSCFLAIILSSPGKRRLRVLYSSCTLVLYSTRTVREGPTGSLVYSGRLLPQSGSPSAHVDARDTGHARAFLGPTRSRGGLGAPRE